MVSVLVHTTLIRDQNGLGFSIAGGEGSPPFKDNSDVRFSIYKIIFYIIIILLLLYSLIVLFSKCLGDIYFKNNRWRCSTKRW